MNADAHAISLPMQREQPGVMPRTRLSRWLCGSVVTTMLFGWGLLNSAARDFGMTDESWFLQVLSRVTAGEVLYRDVFFGATPLSVYLSALAVRLFGVEMLVVKGMVVLCFTATVLLSWRIVRQLGGSATTAGLVALALLAYSSPRQSGVYNPLANVWLLACTSASLAWLEMRATNSTRSWLGLAAASAAAGLCFVTKQNIGLYTLVALLLVIWSTTTSRRVLRRTLNDTCIALAVFGLLVGIVLLPVWVSGAGAAFVDYGFTNKRTYLRVAGIPYTDNLRELHHLVRGRGVLSTERRMAIYTGLAYLLPLLAFPSVIWGILVSWRARRTQPSVAPARRGSSSSSGLVLLFFAGAAFCGLYPRFDLEHLLYALPQLLVALAWGLRQMQLLGYRWMRITLGLACLTWAGLGIVSVSGSAVARIRSSDYQWSTIDHFHGLRISRREHTKMETYAQRLREVMAAEPTFLLTPYAGFSYLVANQPNLTAFDYPLVTAFGIRGMDEVRHAIQERRITTVCLTIRRWSPLRPTELEEYVISHLRRGEIVGWCQLYRVRP